MWYHTKVKFYYGFSPKILMLLIARTMLPHSSKNSVIDVNQSKYLIVVEVSLLNLLKMTHILCAWAVHKRELPPISDKQKQSNQSAFPWSVTQSVNTDSRTSLHHLYIFTCAVCSRCTSTEWRTIWKRAEIFVYPTYNLTKKIIKSVIIIKISTHCQKQSYVWNTQITKGTRRSCLITVYRDLL